MPEKRREFSSSDEVSFICDDEQDLSRKIRNETGEVLCSCDGTIREIRQCAINTLKPPTSEILDVSLNTNIIDKISRICAIFGAEKIKDKSKLKK